MSVSRVDGVYLRLSLRSRLALRGGGRRRLEAPDALLGALELLLGVAHLAPRRARRRATPHPGAVLAQGRLTSGRRECPFHGEGPGEAVAGSPPCERVKVKAEGVRLGKGAGPSERARERERERKRERGGARKNVKGGRTALC